MRLQQRAPGLRKGASTPQPPRGARGQEPRCCPGTPSDGSRAPCPAPPWAHRPRRPVPQPGPAAVPEAAPPAAPPPPLRCGVSRPAPPFPGRYLEGGLTRRRMDTTCPLQVTLTPRPSLPLCSAPATSGWSRLPVGKGRATWRRGVRTRRTIFFQPQPGWACAREGDGRMRLRP